MSEFTEEIRRTSFGGGLRRNKSILNATTTNYELPNDPYHDYEIRLEFGGSTGIRVRPNEKSQMIEDALMERITLEVYGDVRVRLEEYLKERGIADEPREELEAIVEMMR